MSLKEPVLLDLQTSSAKVSAPSDFKTVLSLDFLLDFWLEEEKTNRNGLQSLAVELNQQVGRFPELRGPLTDFSHLESHQELLKVLLSAVLPAALKNLACAAVAPPVTFDFFQATPRFRRELIDESGELRGRLMLDGMARENLRNLFNYLSVLRHCYQIVLPFEKSVLIQNTDSQTGLLRIYQLRAQFDLLRVRPLGKLPGLDREAVLALDPGSAPLQALRELIPAERFEFYGLVVYEATEVTEEHTRSKLKEVLVKREPLGDSQSFGTIEALMQALLKLPELRVTVIGLEQESAFCIDGNSGSRHHTDETPFGQLECENCRSELFEGTELLFADLQQFEVRSPQLERLKEQGARSFLMVPLRDQNSLLGALCLTVGKAGQFSTLDFLRLKGVTELFTLALGRTLASMRAEVQAVMKEKFTAIHPSVEWKFRAAALRYIRDHELGDVVFPEAYSLYSSSDIRSSSNIRNRAIRQDLISQIEAAKSVLALATSRRDSEYLNSLIFRLEKMVGELEHGVRSGDESRISRLLLQEIEPIFKSIESFDTDVHDSVEGYRNAVCADSGSLSSARRSYDASVDFLTRRLTDLLTEQQSLAQQTFPHIFEMYRTDGVEHSIYVGDSLTERNDFSSLYLNELRLWQLKTVCRMAQLCFELETRTPQPLEVAHLILAQSDPVGLRYSQEEKKFNVDGAYNTSYEIIKKRIDKAHIKGTEERLTQPGKIALVYTQIAEAQEYRLFFDYLHQLGFLEPGVETLDLEDLQGVYGLRALRVTVRRDENL